MKEKSPISLYSLLVKGFGKLKDALKHEVPQHIEKETAAMLACMEQYEEERSTFNFVPADDVSFYNYLVGSISRMKNLFEQDKLLIDDYHSLKKISREIGSLFSYLSRKAKFSEKRYFIYHALSEEFFHVNEMMGKTHDAYISKVLRGEVDRNEDFFVEIPSELSYELLKYCRHLGILPLKINLEINVEEAASLFNWAKGNWSIADEGLLRYKVVNSIIQEILTDKIIWDKDKKDQFLSYLEHIKQHSIVLANTMLLIDVKHSIPEPLCAYINNLNCIVEAVKDGKDFKESLSQLMNCKDSHFMRFLMEWESSDQASFYETLLSCLHPLSDLRENEVISFQKAEEIITRFQAFHDLMALYMQNGILGNLTAEKNQFPNVCFDVLEEHADILITLIKKTLEGKPSEIMVTSLMEHHARFILNKVI